MTSMTQPDPMLLALAEARAAAARGEIPVGAVVRAADGSVLARAGNQTETATTPLPTPKSSRCGPPPRLGASLACPTAT